MKADAEAKVRADAEAGQKLDQLLSGIKALSTRFDYVESRLDAFEASAKKDGEEEKKEEARKDRFSKRKDGEGKGARNGGGATGSAVAARSRLGQPRSRSDWPSAPRARQVQPAAVGAP